MFQLALRLMPHAPALVQNNGKFGVAPFFVEQILFAGLGIVFAKENIIFY